MASKITSKFQVIIPKHIRRSLKLSASDSLEWHMGRGYVAVSKSDLGFLDLKGSVKVGKGSIRDDIEQARTAMAERRVV